MKRKSMRNVAIAGLLAGMQIAMTSSFAAAPSPASQMLQAQAAPTVVSTKAILSADEMAKYQQRSTQSRQTAKDKTAGAADNKTVWVVVGIVVVVGVVALAASGGGGGGGGGY